VLRRICSRAKLTHIQFERYMVIRMHDVDERGDLSGGAHHGCHSIRFNENSGIHRLPFSSHPRSEEHTSELQSLTNLVCRLLLEKKKKTQTENTAQKKKKNQKHAH